MAKNLLKLFLVSLVLIALILLLKFNSAGKNPSSADKNLIIIAFDGLQSKHLKSYGYQLDPAPNLEKFLEGSYLFKNAVSPASWTVPSFMSIFTSLYPSEHKLVNKFVEYEVEGTTTKAVKANLRNLNPTAVTLAEILKKNGYATGGFTGDAGVSAAFGYGQGFDEYYDKDSFGGLDISIPKAQEWLEKNKNNKFFLFLHGYDVHGQYAPKDGFDYRYVNQPYAGKYSGTPQEQGSIREAGLAGGELGLSTEDIAFWRAVYDEKISEADERFAGFMKYVEESGLMDNTIIAVLSDHGTEFYEHQKFDHGHTLYGELLDVLLAIRLPGQQQGSSINSLVSTIDLAPTLLSLLGIKEPALADMKGIDLSRSLDGRDVSRDIYSETDYRLYTHKRSIRTPDGWKLVMTMENSNKELYNLNNDPRELDNLIDSEPKIAYELEQKIHAHLKSMNSEGPWIIGCSPVYNDQCQDPAHAKKKL